MRFSVEHTFTSPILVERVLQMEVLLQSIETLCQGKGQIIQIVGEPGVGKTRLITELKHRLYAAPHTASCRPLLLESACFEPDQGVSYAAVTDLVRRQQRLLLEPRTRPGWHSLARLVPELVPPPASAEPAEDKHRFLDDLRSFFIDLSRSYPLLFVIEDVHWADAATLEFLSYLVRNISAQPMLLILTYRDQAVNRTLAQFLAELERSRASSEFNLPRLSKTAVGHMLRSLLRSDRLVRAELLELIYTLTDGNPLFVEEVVKTLAASDQGHTAPDLLSVASVHIPRTVQNAVQERLDQLSKAARDLAQMVAVMGRRFDFRLLQTLSGATEAALLTSIHELIAAQIVIEESADIFAFRHALTRQAIYTQLLARERRALHATIAQALENAPGMATGASDDLAYHFFEAEQWDKAATYSRQAGKKAMAVHAPHTAVLHFTRAINAELHLDQESPDLYQARGQTHEELGDFESAQADYFRALAAARAGGDALAEWHILLALGFLWTSRDFRQAGGYLEQAIALARTIGDAQTLANSLNRVGNWLANRERPREALTYHYEALSIFEKIADASGLAATYDLLAITSLMASELLNSVNFYREAVARWTALGERKGLSSSLATLSLAGASVMTDAAYCPPIPLDEALRQGAEALRIAQEIEWQPGQAGARMYFGLGLISRGEYGRALDAGQNALQIAQGLNHQLWMAGAHMLLGRLYLDLFALELADQHLSEALALARIIDTQFMINANSAFLALVRIWQGAFSAGEALLDSAWGQQQAEHGYYSTTQRLLLAARAELALARGEPSHALSHVDALIATANLTDRSHRIPRLWHLRGQILLALKREQEAEGWLRDALAAAYQQGALAQVWRILAAMAQAYLRAGNKPDAKSAIKNAQDAARSRAGTLTDGALAQAFLLHVDSVIPQLPAPTPRQAAKAAFDGLTDREREIAVLIAQGKANRQIAETLTLSKRTVDAHVGNILSKLGFTSRAQIVRWVVEKGLNLTAE